MLNHLHSATLAANIVTVAVSPRFASFVDVSKCHEYRQVLLPDCVDVATSVMLPALDKTQCMWTRPSQRKLCVWFLALLAELIV